MHIRNPAPRSSAPDPDAVEAQAAAARESDDVRDKMRTIMPWVVSLGGHLGVLVLASLLVFAIKAGIKQQDVPIPDAAIGNEEYNGVPDKAPGPLAAVMGPFGEGPPPAPSDPVTPALPSPPSPNAPHKTSQPNALAPFAIDVPRTQMPSGVGTGHVGKGIFNIGKSDGPTGGDGGSVRAANRIVFLVDASGSLVDTLPFVVESLSMQIERELGPKREFNVIFFSGAAMNREAGAVKGLASLFPNRLERASTDNQRRAVDWVHQVEAGGSGDALAAIRKALDMDPDQIHLLSDNITGSGLWEMHQNKFMEEMMRSYQKAAAKRKLADGHPSRIDFQTYQFVYPDRLERLGMEPTLRRIVRDTGGDPASGYRFITARELGLR